jgi:hypothetical protein
VRVVTDVLAGQASGTHTALVLTGHGAHWRPLLPPGVPVFGNLLEFSDALPPVDGVRVPPGMHLHGTGS